MYPPELLKTQSPVEAQYHKAKAPSDLGNPFIESLPYPIMETSSLCEQYENPLADSTENQETLSATERILQLSQFRQLRLPLPFYKELEYRFYDALCVSYRSRTLTHDEQSKISFNWGEQAVPVKDHLKGDLADSANAGFALLGYSGCGKSSALKSLLSRYPQVIYHNFNGTRIPQIVYLVVSCVPNSNFSALYSSIGRAIDSALGFSYLYQAEIEKKRTLGDKLSKIIELVNHFSIGMLILDEIQLIDFSSTKENSFESLLVLTNETKIAIAVVGTEDAYAKMYATLREARRAGVPISASNYCENKDYFSYLVNRIFQYQFFDTHVPVTGEIVDALYVHTHGIIDQLIGLYIHIQFEYLNRKKRPEINSGFIEYVCNKYYPHLKNLLDDLHDPTVQPEIQKLLQQANRNLDMKLAEAKQLVAAQEIIESTAKVKQQKMKADIINRIQSVTDEFSASEISAEIDKILLKSSTPESWDTTTLTQAIFKELSGTKRRKKPSPIKRTGKKTLTVSHEEMRNALLEQ